jgi:predicted ATPase
VAGARVAAANAGCEASELLPWHDLSDAVASTEASSAMQQDQASQQAGARSLHFSRALAHVAAACDGLSGRTLRKIPFLAHAKADRLPLPCSVERYITAMHQAAIQEVEARNELAHG